MTEEPTSEDAAARRELLVEALRVYGGRYAELSRSFAAHLGLYATDATALLEIIAAEEQGAPISPARLSKRILLSSGATTSLLNRLESAGHIVRSREHSDRRVVTLRSSPHIHERADAFFHPLAAPMDAAVGRYPPAVLDQFRALLEEMCAAMDTHLAHVNQDA
ncbi:MarR family winged helix-turn-helix transcriptional regulator [Streptomyces sp. V2I9]|uniref:MarR family winged helix-turn-helix transcriptional regulator n=1 Tax=Streptomyces sp. V2I9 TaxID=3042304 RepID=UPI0027893F5C|nr:MarR family transcriptional regulator [Streptomyces sp. V2I9]MDQ0986730.1 DNA-binding MarR family transcriptional regulator [Streptomyces sp. V2I9]